MESHYFREFYTAANSVSQPGLLANLETSYSAALLLGQRSMLLDPCHGRQRAVATAMANSPTFIAIPLFLSAYVVQCHLVLLNKLKGQDGQLFGHLLGCVHGVQVVHNSTTSVSVAGSHPVVPVDVEQLDALPVR